MTDNYLEPTEKTYTAKVYAVFRRADEYVYIGYHFRDVTIGVDYFTSSTNKEFVNDFKANPKNYRFGYIDEFTGTDKKKVNEDAWRREQEEINHWISNGKKCLNRSFYKNGSKIFSVAGRKASKEERTKMSAAQKKRYENPEEIAKNAAAQTIAQNKPEVKAKKSAALKIAFNRPEVKAKRSAAINRPEVRAKLSAAMKIAKRAAAPSILVVSPGGFSEIFECIKDAANHYGVGRKNLTSYLNGKRNCPRPLRGYHIEKLPNGFDPLSTEDHPSMNLAA